VPNSTYPKVAVKLLNQALCFYQSLCFTESEMLQIRHLRVAAKRYLQFKEQKTHEKDNLHSINKSNFVYLLFSNVLSKDSCG